MTPGGQWRWIVVYWFVAGIGFGWHHILWVRRRRAKGDAVTAPIGQFVFTVIFAPLALLIVAAFTWQLFRLIF